MAEDLDDGELWLPSEIFPEVGLRRRLHRLPPSSASAARSADLADLARQLAALGLLDPPHRRFPSPNPTAAFPSYSERFSYAARCELAERELAPGIAYDGYRAPPLTRSASPAGFAPGSRPVYFNQRRPSQAEFALWRGSLLQRPQPTAGPNRSFPLRGAAPGRECGGTGVFLPRVAAYNELKKKPNSMRGGEQQQKQQQQQQQATRSAGNGRQGMSFQSEMGLPQDWTY